MSWLRFSTGSGTSSIVFLQQLGRGLRRAPGKRCLTVLDFIGGANRRFRYDLRFRALLGKTGRLALRAQIEEDFPYLPSGCSIQLDRLARDAVLENVRYSIGVDERSLVAELRDMGETTLERFMHQAELSLDDIYRGGRTWSDLKRGAGHRALPSGPQENEVGPRIARLIHVDDRGRLEGWTRILRGHSPRSERERRLQLMLATALLGPDVAGTPAAAIQTINQHPALREELLELFQILDDSLDHTALEFRQRPEVPLVIHCSYSLSEIMAAFGDVRSDRLYLPREGVYFNEPTQCDLLFVTLQKDEADYSPTTM